MILNYLNFALDDFTCGVADVKDRIIGGAEAGPNNVPWMAGIVDKGNDRPFCGGAIISPHHVLTTARCVENKNNVEVVAGELDTSTQADKATRHGVTNILLHPKYQWIHPKDPFYHAKVPDYDIAILYLTTPIDLGPSSNSRYIDKCY